MVARRRNSTPLIGFIGQGFIGKNYADDFERRGYETIRYALEEPYVKNKEEIRDCDFVFIAVPTPTVSAGTSGEGGQLSIEFDASIVRASVRLVGKGKTAVIKSTIVPGTTKEIQKEFPDRTVLYSPEFLSEATAAHDAARPFSNIVGLTENSPKQKAIARELHAVLPRAPFSLTCTSTEAEIIKYSHNGSGYTQVMFFNIMYDLARRHGCDWKPIQRALEEDPMISSRYARPIHKSGRGAGGHCFIKDVAALRAQYSSTLNDEVGAALLETMERKNIQLLRSTGKDLDLLEGVYGSGVLEGAVERFEIPHLSSVRGEASVLICTEAMDKTDPLLGFFHRWVEEFARHADRVHVVSLAHGERSLPPNVAEHTLGKETAKGGRTFKRIVYAARLLMHAVRNLREYDTVLVHLSPEYLIVGGLLWRLAGKRVGFWYNDEAHSWMTRIAALMSDVLFYSNPESFAAQFAHGRRIPMGIDAGIYRNTERSARRGSLLFVGRITPKKRLEETLDALSTLRVSDSSIALDVYGTTLPSDERYAKDLRSRYSSLERTKAFSYRGSVLHDETPTVYAAHDLFIHAGSVRGFNKTLYEAMAAGCLVVTGEQEVREVVHPKLFVEKMTAEKLAAAIESALSLTPEEAERERAKLRAFVQREHALSSVVPTMLEMLSRPGGEGT